MPSDAENLTRPNIVVVGNGPAGLIAAETLARSGMAVAVYDHMPSSGRKFLLAGRGGLNLTHSEPLEPFLTRYGAASSRLEPVIRAFPPEALRAWADELGQESFVGTSGRIFPKTLKTSPLLRAWLARLNELGVVIHHRQEWIGRDETGGLRFRQASGGETRVQADAVILALGGGSWPKLGSNGRWVDLLSQRGVTVNPLRPANCGFTTSWSEVFRDRFQGQPLKTVTLTVAGHSVRGEAMITAAGIEGGAIYALSAPLRDAILARGRATLDIDLRPDLSLPELEARLRMPRRGASFTNFLRKATGLSPVSIGLLRETAGTALPDDAAALAKSIKNTRLILTGIAPIDRAISTAGGIAWDDIDRRMMLKALPGVFVAGEMLDWEAPTGGYLLQAVFSTGVAAAEGALKWLAEHRAATA